MESNLTMNVNFKFPLSEVHFKKLDPRAVIPAYKTPDAAGLDLVALEDMVIWSGETKRVRTGLAWEAPTWLYGRIVPRSSMYFEGFDCDGTIDSDYRGEIMVQLRFLNPDATKCNIHAGQRIAQLLLTPKYSINVSEVDKLSDTERGEGGFGSTGK